jgi:hypothetical protein
MPQNPELFFEGDRQAVFFTLMISPGAPPQTMNGGLRTGDRPAPEQGSIAPSLDKIIFLS